MSGRAEAMATIDNALAAPAATSSPQTKTKIVDDPNAPSATNPAIVPPVPETEEEPDEEEEEPRDRTSDQVDAITGVAKSTFDTKHPTGLDFIKLKNLAVDVESIPTPGSFMFPLLCLIVAFFALIPVNGHTRLTWLLLVITGNAVTTGDLNGGGAGVTPPGGGAILQPPPGNITPLFPFSGTLVEGT